MAENKTNQKSLNGLGNHLSKPISNNKPKTNTNSSNSSSSNKKG